MTRVWSSDGGNLCLAVYFLSVFSTCSTKQCGLQKVEKLTSSSPSIRNIGINLCQIRCNEKGGCLSLEYNHETLTCRLFSDEAKKIKKREGYIVLSKDHFYVQTGHCASMNCGLSSRCLETRSWKYICVDVCVDGTFQQLPKNDPVKPATSKVCNPPSRCSKTGSGKADQKRAIPSAEDCHKIYDASWKGNLAQVKRLLSTSDVNVNCRWLSKTPLMDATWRGRREVVKFLVSRGADVSVVDDNGDTILHMACKSQDIGTVKFILSLNVVDINAKNKNGETASYWGRIFRHWALMELMAAHGGV